MKQFNKFINAAAMVLVLLALVAFFGSAGQFGITDHTVSDAQAERLIHASEEAATSTGGRRDIPLNGGQAIVALDSAGFERLVQVSQEKPVFVMIYASWCPHCKRMFMALNQLQKQHGEAFQVAAISIDNKLELAREFAQSVAPLHLETYIMKDGASYRTISNRLREMGLRFQGGIKPSVPVPYNTVLYKGEPVAEIAGALPDDRLAAVVAEIIKGAAY